MQGTIIKFQHLEQRSANIQEMFNNIIFVGGIHGVGKSTICQKICTELGIDYLSASKIIKWEELSNLHNKKVYSISETQTRLINGLIKEIKKDKFYLLDGHYCLLSEQDEVKKIPLITFREINPVLLGVIVNSPMEITERIKLRDNSEYNLEFVEAYQDVEIKYAHELANQLKVPIIIGKPDNYTDIYTGIKKLIPKTTT